MHSVSRKVESYTLHLAGNVGPRSGCKIQWTKIRDKTHLALLLDSLDSLKSTGSSWTALKGQYLEIFDPQLFLPSNPPWDTDYHPKIFLNLVSISPRYLQICVVSMLCGVATRRYAA
jgi:hypothetical protein